MGQAESSIDNFQKLQPQQQQQQQMKQLIPGLPDEIAVECLVRVPHQFHCNMKLVCQSWRNLIFHPSFYQERRRSGKAEHMVCLIQPLIPPTPSPSPPLTTTTTKSESDEEKRYSQPQYGLSIYNATHQSWHRMKPISGHIGIPMFCQCVAIPAHSGSGSASASGKLVLLGGWDPITLEPVSDVYVVDLIGGGRWKRAAPMSVARSFFACAVVGQSKVYVAGGHDNHKNALKSAEVYDADADEWRTLPPMSEERDECQGLSWEGDSKFWVVSGYSTETQGEFRSDAECYDPLTGSWSKTEGVWPFRRVCPRELTTTTTTTTVSIGNNNNSKSQYQWWWFLGGQQPQPQRQEEDGGEKDKMWKVVNSIQLPTGINATSPYVTTVGLGEQCCNYQQQQQKQRIFVMSNNISGGGRGTSSSSYKCGESESESESECEFECGGEGAYILERESDSRTKWNHVHTPAAFSGFPYSASCLLI